MVMAAPCFIDIWLYGNTSNPGDNEMTEPKEEAGIPCTDMTGMPFGCGITAEFSPPTPQSLLIELEEARRKIRAVESVLLSLVLQEFNSDPRLMARAILAYRLGGNNA